MAEHEESDVELLDNVPDFKTSVPDHLLARLDDQHRYIVEHVGRMEEMYKWILPILIKHRKLIRRLDLAVRSLTAWKTKLTSFWTVVIGAAVLILPVIIKTLLERWLKGP